MCNSYSIKYLGITAGKMGILSRRVPLKRKSIKHLTRFSLSSIPKLKVLMSCSSTIQHKKSKGSFDLKARNNSKMKSHNSQTILPETIQQTTDQAPDNEMIKVKLNGLRKQTAGTMTDYRNDMSWSLSVPLLRKKRSAITMYSITPEKAAQESNEEHLVHTYSFPNALAMQKRQKVITEAERIYFDRYSDSIITQQPLQQSHVIGFKGKKLSQPTLSKKKRMSVSKHRRSVAAHDNLLEIDDFVNKKEGLNRSSIQAKVRVKKLKAKIKENEAERNLMKKVDKMSIITDVSIYNTS